MKRTLLNMTIGKLHEPVVLADRTINVQLVGGSQNGKTVAVTREIARTGCIEFYKEPCTNMIPRDRHTRDFELIRERYYISTCHDGSCIGQIHRADSQPTMYRLNTSLPNLTVGKVYEAALDGTDRIGSYDDNGDTIIILKQFLVEVV